jgi:hypothetical protein
MKLPQTLFVAASFFVSFHDSQAANVVIFNVAGGADIDTLWANADGSLMTTGKVSVGYFGPSVTVDQIDTIAELFSKLGEFTTLTSATPGSSSTFLAPGYVAEDPFQFAPSSLIGRTLYAIATNAASLNAATLSSGYSMFTFGSVVADDLGENDYVANPAGVTPIIGVLGTFTGDPGGAATDAFGPAASGNYTTLKLVAVPEPSTTLLGAVGALALLRRRRN